MLEEKRNRKKLTIAALATCAALAGVGGTVAWLTVQDSLQNQFTVGTFGVPTTKPDPSNPGFGNDSALIAEDADPGSLDGHLYEPNWKTNDEHNIVPGNEYEKDPYVGMTADSEDAYVYIYVKNNAPTEDSLYFNLNEDWEAVTGKANVDDAYEAKATTAEADDPAGNGTYTTGKYYSSGLFKYTSGLTGEGADTTDVWTETPLFDRMLVKADAADTDLVTSEKLAEGNRENSVDVYTFMYQMDDTDGGLIDESEVLDWINDQIAAIE